MLRYGLLGDGVTGAGVTGAVVTGEVVPVISPPEHSTTGVFLGSRVPGHQHLQSFPTNPSPGQFLAGQLAATYSHSIHWDWSKSSKASH